MDVIRILHHRHYDKNSRRFRSLAFKNSSNDGGISVVNLECINQETNDEETVCDHIIKFYQRIAGEPIIYWLIDINYLKETFPKADIQLEYEESDTGDNCHFNIKGLNNKDARKYLKSNGIPPDLRICQDREPIKIKSIEQIEKLLNN